MSRTRRRLAMGRNEVSHFKWFFHTFTHEEARLVGYWRQGMVPHRWLADWETPAYSHPPSEAYIKQRQIDMAFLVHHEVYRNGSCRRQRKAGVRLTKLLERRRTRRKANVRLAIEVRAGEWSLDDVDDILDAGIGWAVDDDDGSVGPLHVLDEE